MNRTRRRAIFSLDCFKKVPPLLEGVRIAYSTAVVHAKTAGFAAHIGYFVPLTKIADFLEAGVEVNSSFVFYSIMNAELCSR